MLDGCSRYKQCYESVHLGKITRRTIESLDAKYEKADLSTILSKCTYLKKEEQAALLKLLLCYKDLFDGMLGTWNGPKVKIKLKKDEEPLFS
jgi:hypothetical protein